jgi:hypothetical protein
MDADRPLHPIPMLKPTLSPVWREDGAREEEGPIALAVSAMDGESHPFNEEQFLFLTDSGDDQVGSD